MDTFIDPDQVKEAKRLYTEDYKSLAEIARTLVVSQSSAKRLLASAGIQMTGGCRKGSKLTRPRAARNPNIVSKKGTYLRIDATKAWELYQRPKGCLQLAADEMKVSSSTISKCLKHAGYSIRSTSEQLAWWKKHATWEERLQRTAHARSRRGSTCSEERLSHAAKRRQETLSQANEGTRSIAAALKAFHPVLEMAVGRYNIDIAFPDHKVAVELDGGEWHSRGQMAVRGRRKDLTLRKDGWLVIHVNSPDESAYLSVWLEQIGRGRALDGGAMKRKQRS